MAYEYNKKRVGLGGLPVWMKASPFIYGAGPYAPGGPGGGMTLGPGKPGYPGPQGKRRVCVYPPTGPKGIVMGRGWPPEIGPQEEALMSAGCTATGIKCGGHYRAPAQYWDCPAGISFPGSVVPHGGAFYGVGNGDDESGGTPWYIIPALVIVGGVFLAFEGVNLYGMITGKPQRM